MSESGFTGWKDVQDLIWVKMNSKIADSESTNLENPLIRVILILTIRRQLVGKQKHIIF
jgi:hypothetical protein